MIPLGTGLFKTMYDTNMHNRIIKKKNEEKKISDKNNNNYNINDADKGLERHRIGYEDNQNIIEVKLKNSNRFVDNDEISNKMSFNLVDLIN